jgi:putative chitinase
MSKLHEKYKTLLDGYHINTPLRLAHFMAQIEHESKLKPISENLNYSAEGLSKTFPKYFPTIQKANEYARKPILIASKVYANRMGNGSEQSGEGWKYRGRGFLQITGKDNYLKLSKDTQINCLNNPDLLLEEPNAMISACWFWQKNNINALADNDDVQMVSLRINGGSKGLKERIELTEKWKKIL